MGCCATGEHKFSSDIDKKYGYEDKKEKQIRKLLMLGSGASGKSTLFKQLGWLYGVKETDKNMTLHDSIERLSKIRESIIGITVALLTQSQKLFKKNNIKYKKCLIDLDNLDNNVKGNIVNNIKIVAEYQNIQFLDYIYNENDENKNDDNDRLFNEFDKLGNAIYSIWKLNEIQETFKHRNVYSIPDNMEYFFNKSKEIFKYDYKINKEDYLKARVRTTGVTKLDLKYETQNMINQLRIIDVGGQRNERQKWIHQFDTVTAVIYVAALNIIIALLRNNIIIIINNIKSYIIYTIYSHSISIIISFNIICVSINICIYTIFIFISIIFILSTIVLFLHVFNTIYYII